MLCLCCLYFNYCVFEKTSLKIQCYTIIITVEFRRKMTNVMFENRISFFSFDSSIHANKKHPIRSDPIHPNAIFFFFNISSSFASLEIVAISLELYL